MPTTERAFGHPMIQNTVLRHEHHACSVATDASLSQITIDDQPLFAAALASLTEPVSDASFAASLCWSQPFELRKALIEGHLCLFSAADGDLSMMLPPLPLSPTMGVVCVEKTRTASRSARSAGSSPTRAPAWASPRSMVFSPAGASG